LKFLTTWVWYCHVTVNTEADGDTSHPGLQGSGQ
jgi:hypothetical protein